MSTDIAALVSDNLELWTSAIERKSGAGRGGSNKVSLYGIERLRALILDLAVRGKLVPQDTREESATKLLARIRSSKPEYLTNHDLPKQRSLTGPIEQVPFELPDGWIWTRLGDIAAYIQRGKSPKYSDGSGVYVVSQRCVQWTGLDLSVAKEISQASLENYEPYRFLRPDDLLWNSTGTGTIGRVITLDEVPEGLVCDSHVTLVRCPWVNARYLQTWLASDAVYGQIELLAAGSTNQIEWTAQLANGQLVPVPPFSEQHRIVAKVEELMALCDALEVQSTSALESHQTLVETLLATLVNSSDATDLAANWARLETHFDTLFTTEASIDALKQVVLNLAIRGKIVCQDDQDEAARLMLQRLQAEQGNGKRARKITKATAGSVEPAFQLPSTWEWSTLGDLALDLRYGTSKKCERGGAGTPVLRIPNVSGGVVNLIDLKFGPLDDRERDDLKLNRGDLLIIRSNGSLEIVGRFAVVPQLEQQTAFAGYLVRARVDQTCILPKYIWYASNSKLVRDSIEGPIRHGVGLKNLNLTELSSLRIPVPPLSEQHRIVAKVDELMALCDALKAHLTDVAETQKHLADAIVERAAA